MIQNFCTCINKGSHNGNLCNVHFLRPLFLYFSGVARVKVIMVTYNPTKLIWDFQNQTTK